MIAKPRQIYFFCLILLTVTLSHGQETTEAQPNQKKEETRIDVRAFSPTDDQFRGNGIAYGPFRKGQRPGGAGPTLEQIRQDLKILSSDGWQMIRTYGTEPFAKKVCEVIQQDQLPIKVMLGAWIATEKNNPRQRVINKQQASRAIRLAKQYQDVVVAVSVGNETQVSWSFHKVEQSTLLRYVRQVREAINQPVTVADDFKFWRTKESKAVAAEIDFIVTHAYAMWLGEQLDDAVDWTKKRYREVCDQHVGKLVVIGEAGWATQKSKYGEQAKLIKGKPGEQEQKEFFDEFTAWTRKDKIPYFYFEAFDEPWKGGNDPNEVEKHWGIFRENRTRKEAATKLNLKNQ